MGCAASAPSRPPPAEQYKSEDDQKAALFERLMEIQEKNRTERVAKEKKSRERSLQLEANFLLDVPKDTVVAYDPMDIKEIERAALERLPPPDVLLPVAPTRCGLRTLKGAEHVEVDQTGYKLRHQKKKNHNQDTAMATLLHAGEENEPLLLVGVYDGHGVDGHQASRVAARGVSSSFVAAAMEGTSWGPALTLGCYAAEVKMRDELPAAAFHSSGTTAIIAAVGGTSGRCVLANLGDSRGVKLSAAVAPGGDPRDESAGWRVALETADHKPEAAVERARIEEAGGCVYWPPMFKKGVGRVCTKATATTIDAVHAGQMTMAEVHGKIAMMAISRTIGDDHFTACGVTSEPEIYETTIEEADRALVLATDGLWDCVSSAEVAEIAHAHRHSALAAAEALERVAALRAAKADGYRDDITVAVIFLPLRSLSAADGAAGFAAPEPHADPTEAPQRWPVRAKSDLVLVEDMMEDGLSEASVVDASRLSADNGKPSQSWFSPTSTMDC